jgi:hypothetical protein
MWTKTAVIFEIRRISVVVSHTEVYHLKKFTYIFMIILLAAALTSCLKTEKNPSIGEPVVAKSIDRNTSKPLEPASRFIQSDPVVYFTIKVTDLPRDTKLKAVWKYITDGTEVSSEITTGDTRYEAFTLKRSGSQFPAGKYEVTVTGEANGKALEAKGSFEIAAEAKPTHLMNPLTSKSIDGNDKMNPVNVTSEFTQSDSVIYFVVQSKDLPEDTKVTCLWYYADTGDSLVHELTTDGNRNISFSLKPDQGQKLPAGKYLVTASATINGETESISKEFEVK